MSRTWTRAAVVSLAIAPLMTHGAGEKQPTRVPLKDHGFSVEVPKGWNVAINPDNLPMFTNFPFSKLQPQLTLPKGGAIINFIAWAGLTRRSGDESLSGWGRLDARGSAKATVVAGDLQTPLSSGISGAITTAFDNPTYGPDDQAQREFSVYWIFQTQKFAAHLFYVTGDPNGPYYENTLKSIVRSVTPLGPAARHDKK